MLNGSPFQNAAADDIPRELLLPFSLLAHLQGNSRVPISSSATAPRKTLSSKSPTVRTYSSYSLFSALLKEKPRFDTKGARGVQVKPQSNTGSEFHALDSSAASTSLSNLPLIIPACPWTQNLSRITAGITRPPAFGSQ